MSCGSCCYGCLIIPINTGLLLEHAVDGALVLAFLDGLALVELALASCRSNDQFSQTTLVDEETQGDNGDTGLLGVAGDAANLLAVEQQLAVAVGRVVVIGAVAVLGNIHVLDPHLTINDHAIGIGQAALALTDGLDLGTGEHNARGEGLDDLVIKRRLAVLDIDRILICLVRSHCSITLFNDEQIQDNAEQQRQAQQQRRGNDDKLGHLLFLDKQIVGAPIGHPGQIEHQEQHRREVTGQEIAQQHEQYQEDKIIQDIIVQPGSGPLGLHQLRIKTSQQVDDDVIADEVGREHDNACHQAGAERQGAVINHRHKARQGQHTQ